MNVLIDNSTYYSFKMALEENEFDAHIVYNMANFLECVVVADKVCFAPTTLWHPDATDGSLFSEDGPCIQLNKIGSDEIAIASTFRKAINESIKDLSRKVIRNSFSNADLHLDKAAKLLNSWKVNADHDPLAFMETYSGLVYLTDTGTSKFFVETFGSHTRTIPTYHHLANYLLRSNVAMEISERLVYHPHSHRTPLVCEKMALQAHESASIVSELIRDTEAVIENEMSANARDRIISRYGSSSWDADLPLVLAVVLSGAKTPGDIIPLTISLRNTRAAQRYRKWTTKLVTAFREGDPSKVIEARRKLKEAKQTLTNELIKLYDARRDTDLSRYSKFASVPVPEEILSANLKSLIIKAGKELIKSTPDVLKLFKNMGVRRNVALLLNLAKKRSQIDNLNLLLERTFHKKLNLEQTCTLNDLRMNQGKLMAQLIFTS